MKGLRTYLILLVALIYFLGQYLYNADIVENYAYLGFEIINFDLLNFLVLLSVSCYVPLNISKPSDAFCIFYFIVILSCLTFTQPLVNYNFSVKIQYMLFLIFPFLFMIFVARLKSKVIGIHIDFGLRQFNLLIYLLLIICFAVLLNYGLKSGGFGFESLYERRLEGRILSGRLTGYLIGFACNTMLAYFSFKSGMNGDKISLFISIAIILLSFYSLGLKSPVVTLIIFWFIGFMLHKNFNLSIALTQGTLVLILVSFIELYFNEISLVNLFTIRRIFVVQAEVTQFYFDAFILSSFVEKSVGINLPGNYTDLTYYIGDRYLDNTLTNANTNTFFYFLTKYGILGYIVCNIVVCFFLKYLDQYYSLVNGSYLILAASVFSYLITEQAFTVTLVSSGVGLFSILTILLYDSFRVKLHKHEPFIEKNDLSS